MSILSCYHGTSVGRAREFLDKKEIHLSLCGDPSSTEYRDLWLGDGFYLFDDPFHAFKWIVNQCHFGESGSFDLETLRHRFCMLQCKLNYQQTRTFDLRQTEYLAIFQKVLEKIRNNTVPDVRIPSGTIPDGVVINYMFSRMNYDKRFDLVCAVYKFNEDNFTGIPKLKLGFVPQTQYCVKKKTLIEDIREYEYTDYIDTYKMIWETLFPKAKPLGTGASDTYSLGTRTWYES